MNTQVRRLRGFSLSELLVVVVIVTLLAIAIIMGYQTQIAKANDAKRKDNLNEFRIAFENYYNDNSCYPTEAVWNGCTCDGNCLSPYMENFLCDPTTRQKYFYYPFNKPEPDVNTCIGYRLYAKLENRGDPDIISVGCDWIRGCGDDDRASYNYGISMTGSLTAADFVPNPTSTPTPTPIPIIMGEFFCLGDGSRICNAQTGCVPTFDKRYCNEVLINEFGCQGFVSKSSCDSLCETRYDQYKCPATETLDCLAWRRTPCQ